MVTTITGLDPSAPTKSWWASSHTAGMTRITDWSTNNVRLESNGTVDLILDNAPSGSAKPFMGGEINSNATLTTGTLSWTAKAPDMVDGAVFGLFGYRSDWKNGHWIEFDFEFVGDDTRHVQLTVHMENDAGQRVMNLHKTVVDLGFDAAAGFHTYDIVLNGKSAVFRADGHTLGTFDKDDMPGGIWRAESVKSIVDLWAGDSRYDSWAGHWSDPGRALIGRVSEASVEPGNLSGSTSGTSQPAPSSGSGDDTVSVKIRGDAWKGDPTFALLVNGQMVDASTAVTADRVDGEWDTFTFHGDFHLDGTDRVSVRFLNNLNEGPGMDRNLYVDQVSLNGEVNGTDGKLVYNTTLHWDF
jgi:beta-glucanase (GH16 family)